MALVRVSSVVQQGGLSWQRPDEKIKNTDKNTILITICFLSANASPFTKLLLLL